MTLAQTIRIAARSWRRSPALMTTIVLTLAFGIGASTTAFTLAWSVLMRPLPFPEPDRLVWITSYDTRRDTGAPAVIPSNRLPQFADWQRHLRTFEQIGAWAGEAPDVFTVTGEGTPERVNGLRVTQQLLPILGASTEAGRLFRPGEDMPDVAQTVVLSHGYWQRRFNSQPDVVGRSVTIENVPHTVVGILGQNFPLSGTLFEGAPIDVYLPLTVDGNEDIGGFMSVVGRVRPGVTLEQAREDLAARQVALSVGRWQFMRVFGQRVQPLPELVTRGTRSPVLLLLAGVGCVLLLTCANVANLLLVRASGRRREMQVRAALGASLGRVFKETTAESALPAVVGTGLGVALTVALTEILRQQSSLSIARVGELRPGWEALTFAAALCAATTLVFGGLPLLHLRRRDAMDALRPHAGATKDRRAGWVQRVALAAQVAFAVTLAVAGVLLARSFAGLVAVDPGFMPQGAVAMRVDPAGRLPGPARVPFFTKLLDDVRAIPGVDAAALTIHTPMGDRPSMGWDVAPEGPVPAAPTPVAAGRIITPGYFATVGVPVHEGRDFDERDVNDHPYVMVVNDTLARRLRTEGREPIGARFMVLGNVREVIAIVGDVKHGGLATEAGLEVYIPMAQAPRFFASYDLVVRGDNPMALVPAVREAIWEIDGDQAIGTPVPLEDYIDRTLAPRRLLTFVVGGFAVAGLFLAALGVYGIVGYRIAQRTKEVALRIALGAPRWRVTTTLMRDTLAFVALGLIAGVPLALAAAAAIRAYLFGVEPDDAGMLVTACAMVVALAVLAAYLPARRAPHVDPAAALRAD